MIVGIVGNGIEVTQISNYFEKKGFTLLSLHDELILEAKRRNITLSPKNLQSLHIELQVKYGKSVLATWAKLHIEKSKSYLCTSITNTDEIQCLEEEPGFCLIALAKNSTKVQGELAKKAKIVLKINVSEEELHKKIDQIIFDVNKSMHTRPSWDEYFMGIVDSVSTRATCDRGRTAVVIVKDKRILTTGYVGSPMGIAHCDDVGHQMKKTIHEDGRISQHCVRTIHGEQNAIALAARKGIPLEGGTLYCKLEPCFTCAKMLINTGIVRVVCRKRYHAAQDSRVLFKKAGINVTILDEVVESYVNQ